MGYVKSLKKKEIILHVAKQHFATLGYDAATLKGIAVDAQTTAASLTYYFTSKESLLDQAIRDSVCNFSSRIIHIACSRGSAGERLTKMAGTYFAYLRDDEALQIILEREADHLAQRPLFAYIAEAKSHVDDAWRHVLGDLLARDEPIRSGYRIRIAKRVIERLDIMSIMDDTLCDQRTKIYLRNKLIDQIVAALFAQPLDERALVKAGD